MSLLDSKSDFLINSGVDLFEVPPTDTSLSNVVYEEFRPVSSFENSSTINFIIPSQSERYIDLASTCIHLNLRIEDDEGKLILYDATSTATINNSDLVTFANNTAQTLWSYIDVYLNDELVSTPNIHSHPYQAYLQRFLHEDINIQKSISEQAFYYRDKDSHLKGFIRTSAGANVEIIDTLAIDVFQ